MTSGACRAWMAGLVFAVAATGAAASEGADLATTLGGREGQVLDLVELGTGERIVRPTLEKLVVRDGKVVSLRLKAEGETRAATVLLPAIIRIVADREPIYEAEAKGTNAAQLRSKRARAVYEKGVAESVARMQSRGVEPWPQLSADEHAAEVTALEAFVKQVQGAFPRLTLDATHEFLVATDIPPAQMQPFVAGLDRMHDVLCDLYGIPLGEPVWKGKCLVIAFHDETDFVAFEGRFMRNDGRGAHGLCHQRSDGRVITACHQGSDVAAFAHMLVHETSHGFNHRWMSPVRLPNWLNEGIAEWVGTKVVPQSNQVPLKEAHALEVMRARGDLGDEFFTADNIQAVQYGMASGLVKFLTARDPRRFAAFVRGIKEGGPVEESIRAAYGATLDELVTAYGQAVGVPGLKRQP
jgi:hypothetical protein